MKLFKLYVTCLVAAYISLTSWGVYAEESANAKPAEAKQSAANDPMKGMNPWVDCGIGAMIFSNTRWAAATSNVIWDLGTTAVTSASVSPQTCEGSRVKVAALFINSTYENLAEETAVGQGEHLSAVLDLMGCDATRHSVAIQNIRAEMGTAVGSSGYIARTHNEKAAQFYSIVNGAVSRSCSA